MWRAVARHRRSSRSARACTSSSASRLPTPARGSAGASHGPTFGRRPHTEPRSKLELPWPRTPNAVPPPDEPRAGPSARFCTSKASGKAPPPQQHNLGGYRQGLGALSKDMLHEQGTRRRTPHLHDMRVATRRLRSAMRLMRPYLRSPHAARVQRGLSALGGALGAVRDLDVALGHLAAFRDQAGTLAAPGLQVLQDDWSAQRDVARKKMLRYLDRKGYRRLLKELDRLLDDLYAPEQDGRATAVDWTGPRLIKCTGTAVEAHGKWPAARRKSCCTRCASSASVALRLESYAARCQAAHGRHPGYHRAAGPPGDMATPPSRSTASTGRCHPGRFARPRRGSALSRRLPGPRRGMEDL